MAIIGRPNVGKSTLLNQLAGEERSIVSPIAGTTRDSVDTLVQHAERLYRFVDTAGIRRKGKTTELAEKLSVIMARKSLERTDVALLIVDASQGVASGDATIADYAGQSGCSVVIVMNKFDLALESARKALVEERPKEAQIEFRGEGGRQLSRRQKAIGRRAGKETRSNRAAAAYGC